MFVGLTTIPIRLFVSFNLTNDVLRILPKTSYVFSWITLTLFRHQILHTRWRNHSSGKCNKKCVKLLIYAKTKALAEPPNKHFMSSNPTDSAIPSLFLLSFGLFKQTVQFLQQIYVKISIQIAGIRTMISWTWVFSHNHLTGGFPKFHFDTWFLRIWSIFWACPMEFSMLGFFMLYSSLFGGIKYLSRIISISFGSSCS